MKTLIELFDERPIENVLATEVFAPERTVIVCPPEAAENRTLRTNLTDYFRHRGCQAEVLFVPVSLLDAEKVADTLRSVIRKYPGCAVDISGGTDASLFAAGLVCAGEEIPVFTYSRKRNMFFEISHAPFARNLPCTVRQRVEDCFLMAGGSMLSGRMDAGQLGAMLPMIDPFYALYSANRRRWAQVVTYIQRISQADENGLTAEGPCRVKGERGSAIDCPEEILRKAQEIGLIRDLRIEKGERVSFRFRNALTRFWLRDVGSVLELYVYKACRDLGIFDDVCLSAVVNWGQGAVSSSSVTNEIDVACTRGVMPVFISCKTCEIRTDALNELSVLRERFGSEMARAVIVTSAPSTRVRASMRHRAAELGIDVIEQGDLSPELLRERLQSLALALRPQ